MTTDENELFCKTVLVTLETGSGMKKEEEGETSSLWWSPQLHLRGIQLHLPIASQLEMGSQEHHALSTLEH